MAGVEGTDPRIRRSFSIMSPTGGRGTRHQRLLATLLDPTIAAGRKAVARSRRDDRRPKVVSWWEL
jgi:hypothetical protein